MGFFDDLKKEISQAVTELVSDEELLKEDGYDAGDKNITSQSAEPVDAEYIDEDDYIETEDDYKEDEPQSMGVVVDDLASDEYVNTMNIDIKDLIASYSNELNQDTNTQPAGEEIEEQYGADAYDNQYETQYGSAAQAAEERYMGSLPEEEEAPGAMEAMSAMGFSDELAQMYGDDDDVMVNTLDDDVFGEPAMQEEQEPEPESLMQEQKELPEKEEAPPEPEAETLPEILLQEQEPEAEKQTAEELLPEEAQKPEKMEEPMAQELPIEVVQELPAQEETKAQEVEEQADWITEEPLPDDFDTEFPEMQEIISKESVSETIKEPDEEPVTEVSVSIEPEIKKPVTKKPEKKEPAAKKTAVKESTIKEPASTPEMIVKKQPEEKKVKKEVKEEQEEVLMPTFEEDTPNARDILEDMADYSEETTVITKGVVVKGDIISGGSINVLGEVEGNITCKGKLMVSGTIHGNAEAGELFANDAHITGNILNAGSVKIGQGSIIIGNVTGSSAVIAGAIKGDIDVKGPVVVDSTAIIMGDIKSKSVQINNGAAIEGRCSQCYADVNPTSFFKEN